MKKIVDEPKIAMTFSVPVDTYLTVRQLSKERKEPMAEFLRYALETYLTANGIEKYDLEAYLRAKKKVMELELF